MEPASSKGRGSFHFINNNINNFSVGIQMGGALDINWAQIQYSWTII